MFRTRDATDWMWAEAVSLLDEAERLHRQFFRLAASPRPDASWQPPVDVLEDDREIVVIVALPGVAPERVSVVQEGDVLVVRAERPLPFAGSPRVVRRLEIPYGVFERRIALPGGPLVAGAPELAHGCLVVRLTKTSNR
jgi:HSP20 family molecular chaperone IbpA